MKRPLHYKRSITKKRLHLLVAGLCVLTTVELVGTSYFCRNDIKQSDIRSNLLNNKCTGFYTVFLMNFGLFTLGMIVSSIWIAVQLRGNKRKVKYNFDKKSSDAHGSDSKVTVAFSVVLGVYIVTFVPAYTCFFIVNLAEVPYSDILIDVTYLIHFITTFVNPLIYCAVFKDFRKGYKNLLLCKNTSENQDSEITKDILQERELRNASNHLRQF